MIDARKAILFAFLTLGLMTALCAAGDAAGNDDLIARADAVYLDVRDEYTLKPDGSIVHRHVHKMRTETHYALHGFTGESFVVYNPEYQELKIHRSRTTMRDGKQVDSTPNAFNLVLPRFCDKALPYMGLREMVVTHLGMEPGAVVDFDYEIRSRAGFLPYLMGEEVFGGTHPILRRTVVVTVPQGVDLKSRLFNHDPVEPVRTDGDGFETYQWTLTDLPLVPREPMADAAAEFAPRLVFSTCPSWADASRTMAERFAAAECCPKVFDKVLRDVKKGTTDGVGEADPVGLMRSLNRFVASDTAGASVPPALTGYRVLSAAETFKNSVGTSFDRCALLLALLKAAGLQAEPVLASARRAFAAAVPSWHQFGKCRVLCRPGGSVQGTVLLDPARVGGLAREEGLAGGTILRFTKKGDQVEGLPGSCSRANSVKARVDLALDKKLRLTGSVLLEVAGDLNPYLQLGGDYGTWAEGRMRGLVPGARFGAVSARLLGGGRSIFSAKIVEPATLDRTGVFAEMTLPGCPGGAIDMHAPLASARRTTPLRLPRAITEELDLTVKLPAGVTVAVLPGDVDVIGLPGEIRVRCSVDGGVLRINRRLEVERVVAPEDYPALRRILTEWIAPDARRILLKPSGGKTD